MSDLISARTDFSLGESIIQTKVLVNKARDLGYKAIALADTMTVSGMVEFSKLAKDKSIKPIIGATLRIVDDPTYRAPSKASGEKAKRNSLFMPKVYAKSDKGFRSILKLLSRGNTEDYFYYHSRVGLNELLELEDVVVTTGDLFGLFSHPDALGIFKTLKARFGEDLLVEVSPINTPLFDKLNAIALKEALAADTNVIFSYPSLYDDKSKADTLDVYRAIVTSSKVASHSLPKPYVRDFALMEPSELPLMVNDMLFKRLGFTYLGAQDIKVVSNDHLSKVCEYEFKKLEPSLPNMSAKGEFNQLVENVKIGWSKRLSKEILGYKPDVADLPKYKARLAYELDVLKRMNFSGYFLLVQDIVNWSKENGVIVGPGRGSCSGSLVSYLLGITDADPIRFGLLFERFINPDRLDLPDADLDYQSTRRLEVIQYAISKYGQDYVAGVSNYGTLASASALRDAGRVYDLPPLELTCTKLVPKEHGQPVTLEVAKNAVPEIEKFAKNRPDIWEHAVNLEGMMRSLGQHAAGLVIAGEPLVNRAVVETRTGGAVVNWDKRYVEDFGLIKLDILGLAALDVLQLAAEYIFKRHGTRVNYLEIELDNPVVLETFSKGDTTAIFQFESSGMKSLLKRLAKSTPLTFEDTCAVTALYRPGPMDSGMLEDYVSIRTGARTPYYESPLMIPALEATHGVIIYQESVMQLARDLAGFTMAEADGVRKMMGKKDLAGMKKYKDKFIEGCAMGEIEIELDDGTIKRVHRASKFLCSDGVKRTVEEAYVANLDITQW